MHHSAVTSGAGLLTITTNPNDKSTGFIEGNTSYDVLYNDSLDIGLSRNEMDGSIDDF